MSATAGRMPGFGPRHPPFSSLTVAIVGRSGSGTSTLLNILGMLDLPSSGEVDFRGNPVFRDHGKRMRRGALDRLRGREVGFVFQF